MKIILDEKALQKTLQTMAQNLFTAYRGFDDLIFVGIQRRGVILSQRIAAHFKKQKRIVPQGTLDINLYRDDFSSIKKIPTVQKTEISENIEGKGILLFDEVLYTGRTIRAALDALMDLGRPRFIKLAVLVDRGGRELPIQPDFLGIKHEIGPKQEIEVRFKEIDGEEEVRVK